MLWYSAVVLFSLKLFVVLPISCQRVPYKITYFNVRVSQAFNTITVPVTSLKQCVKECTYRQNCKAINYSERRKWCECLDYTDESTLARNKTVSFVHIKRSDIYDSPQDPNACSSCVNGVCDPKNGTCNIIECPDFRVAYGQVVGNMKTVGSRVSLLNCNANHLLSGAEDSVCQADGTWSSLPSCLWDCRAPRGYPNAIVTAGDTTNGTVRTYNCIPDFFISGNRTVTAADVTCNFGGTWDSGPRCVIDCDEPRTAHSHFAENRTGSGLEDFATRTFVCPTGTAVFLKGIYAYKDEYNTTYIDRMTKQKNRTVRCDGLYPHWAGSNFLCAKVCKNPPSTSNVKRVNYIVNRTETSLEYVCRNGYSVFSDSKRVGPDPAWTVCNDTDDNWWDADFTCQIDCRNPPTIPNMGDITYTFNLTHTVANYTCADGYAMSDGSTFLSGNAVTGVCDTARGDWNFTDFTCAMVCHNPPISFNIGEITYTFHPTYTVATYACANDYVIWDGSSVTNETEKNITCATAGGVWSYAPFLCAKGCFSPPTTENVAHINYTFTASKTDAEYVCKPSYVIMDTVSNVETSSTSRIATCVDAGGMWQNTGFACVEATPGGP